MWPGGTTIVHLLAKFTALPLLGLVLSSAALAQAPPTDITKLVRDASYNETRASNGQTFRYLSKTTDGGKSMTKEVVESHEGGMSLLIEENGKPLDADAAAAEKERLMKLRRDPAAQAKRQKHNEADDARSNRMVRLLPDAFTYTFMGMVTGPDGPCYRLSFVPNPNFQPPDREAAVYHGMAGELWIDQAQQRLVRLDAHLTEDVDFGWGVVGRLFKGGTILVEQRDVGDHRWETVHETLHLSGKILLVKALKIDTTEEDSDFKPVPDLGYQAAIDLLLSGAPS